MPKIELDMLMAMKSFAEFDRNLRLDLPEHPIALSPQIYDAAEKAGFNMNPYKRDAEATRER